MNKLQVSIIILNCNYPHNIKRLLPTLKKTSGVNYEIVVVDNGSTPDVVSLLKEYQASGFIDNLVLESENHYFSEGNNIGVCNSNPDSEFVLLLNSDTEILRDDWLARMLEWIEGVPKVLYPLPNRGKPTEPKDIRRGIVSIDWVRSFDVPGCVAPDGWCCLIRREAWRDMDPNFPMAFGILKMLASAIDDGHPCGALSQYGSYIKHYGQGSVPPNFQVPVKGTPDLHGWWKDVTCESLDFTYHEDTGTTDGYMSWSHLIEPEFENAKSQKSDINEHIQVLHDLATECDTIVEAGVRYVVSTWAFVWGCACRGGRVDSYCMTMLPEIQRAIDLCGSEEVPWYFYEGDWLKQEIPETDLLFIDTNHFYSQLKEELRIHGPKARKYIVLHDTENFGQVGADEKSPGLWQAVEEFVAEGNWRIKEHYTNCNGLTVLEKKNENQ